MRSEKDAMTTFVRRLEVGPRLASGNLGFWVYSACLALLLGPGTCFADNSVVVTLLQKTRSPNYWEAVEASDSVREMGDAAIPALLEVAKSTDFRRNTRADDFLRRLSPATSAFVPGLIAELQSGDLQTRVAAARALRAIGPPSEKAIPELLELLKETDEDASRIAAWALRTIGKRADIVVPALIRRWSREANYHVQIANDLRPFGEQAIPHILANLQNATPTVRAGLATFLGATTLPSEEVLDALIAIFHDPVSPHRGRSPMREAAKALAKHPETASRAVPEILRTFQWLDSGESIRADLAKALGAFESRATEIVPVLRKSLRSDRLALRLAIVEALISLEGPSEEFVPILKEAVSSRATRRDAIKTMGKMGKAGKDLVPTLVSFVDNDEHRHAAFSALGDLGRVAKKAAPKLSAIFRGLRWDRQVSMGAVPICKIDPKACRREVIPILRKGIRMDDHRRRYFSLYSLHLLGQPARKALPDLKKLLDYRQLGIRSMAAGLVLRLSRDEKDRRRALDVLIANLRSSRFGSDVMAMVELRRSGRLAAPAVGPLSAFLEGPDKKRRELSRKALAAIGTAEAQEALKRASSK